MLRLKVWICSAGTAAMVGFVLCVIFGLLVPESLHAPGLLEQVLPGFRWLTPASFFLGVVESFLWGAYLATLFVPVHNFFYRRWERGAAQGR